MRTPPRSHSTTAAMCNCNAASVRRASSGEEEICWICHDGHAESNELFAPCACPVMRCHRSCLSRWQLQQAGKKEERECRFCGAALPDWRELHSHLPKANPIMTVVHNGRTYQVTVEPGPSGQQQFQAMIREIFGLADDDAIQLTFGCKVPGSAAQEITLEGWEAFDAAVHCAALSAGQRMLQKGAPSSHTGAGSPRGVGAVAADAIKRLFSRSSPGA